VVTDATSIGEALLAAVGSAEAEAVANAPCPTYQRGFTQDLLGIERP
jgi:hypothetical protein